jgi:hypothetical protein
MRTINHEQIFLEQINALKEAKNPVIIFGARHIGKLFKIALESINTGVLCYCDNNKKLQGCYWDGVEVLSPEQCYERFPNAIVVLGMMNDDNCLKVKQQLTQIGFCNFLNRDPLLYLYHTQVLKRQISNVDFIDSLLALSNSDNKLIINDVVLFITEKCTLNCENCSALIPYNQNPVSYDSDRIIESMRRFAESVDTIVTVNILGGEPLLHADLSKICSELSKISNLISIRIVTNGTLVLDSESLELIKRSGAYFHISNYGELSYKKEELIHALVKHNIPYDLVEEFETWYPVSPPIFKGRNESENAEVFDKCIWQRACPEIRNGQFHLCGYSASGTSLGLIPSTNNDYVEIMNPQLTKDKRREQILKLLSAKTISACGYCGYDFSTQITRAVQLERKK